MPSEGIQAAWSRHLTATCWPRCRQRLGLGHMDGASQQRREQGHEDAAAKRRCESPLRSLLIFHQLQLVLLFLGRSPLPPGATARCEPAGTQRHSVGGVSRASWPEGLLGPFGGLPGGRTKDGPAPKTPRASSASVGHLLPHPPWMLARRARPPCPAGPSGGRWRLETVIDGGSSSSLRACRRGEAACSRRRKERSSCRV